MPSLFEQFGGFAAVSRVRNDFELSQLGEREIKGLGVQRLFSVDREIMRSR